MSDRSELGTLIDKYFRFGYNKYVFYSDSIDHYIGRQRPSLRRMMIYHAINANLMVVFLVYAVIAIHPNRQVIKNLGPPYFTVSIEGARERIVLAMYSFIVLVILLARLAFFHYESRFQLFALDFLYQLRGRRSPFKLNFSNQKKFKLVFYAFYYGFTKGMYLVFVALAISVHLAMWLYVFIYKVTTLVFSYIFARLNLYAVSEVCVPVKRAIQCAS